LGAGHNNGFACKKFVDLDGEYESTYIFENLNAKPPHGIEITLRDYGDGHWTFNNLVGHSKDLAAKVLQITEALK
jgi:hypothetical protein